MIALDALQTFVDDRNSALKRIPQCAAAAGTDCFKPFQIGITLGPHVQADRRNVTRRLLIQFGNYLLELTAECSIQPLIGLQIRLAAGQG